MDKSNEKGRTRNRYAKVQPLVNRMNGLQDFNLAANSFNYRDAGRCNDHSIDSYAHQLQNDFGNLVQAVNRKTKVIKNPMGVEIQNSKMSAALLDQSVFSPATSADTLRRQKKHKNKNKEKLYRTSLPDLKAELLDILNCIVYILWSPIIFFTRLFLTLVNSSASALYNMSKLPSTQGKNAIQKVDVLQSTETKPEISIILTANSCEDKQAPNSNNLLAKRSCDFNPGSDFDPQGVKNSVTIGQLQIENVKSQKELQSMRKKFSLSLEMVDEMRGNLKLEGGNYFQYSSHHRDNSSIELSNGCSSDKYSSRFLDHENSRKRITRQYHDSFSIAEKKMSFSALRNSCFKGSRMVVNSKQLRLDSRNSSRTSELKLQMMKNLHAHLPGTSEFSDKQVQRIDSKNQSYGTDKCTDLKPQSVNWDSSVAGAEAKFDTQKKSSTTLLTNFRKKRYEKSKPHAFAPLPLRPTLQKDSSSEDDGKYNCTSSKDFKDNLVAANSQIINLQPVVKPNHQLTKKLETYVDIHRDSLRKKEFKYTAVVPINLNQSNAQKVVSKYDAETSNLQCKLNLGTLINETTVSGSLKDVFNLDEVTQKDEHKKKTEWSQSKKICRNFEEEKKTNGSGDRLKASENETSKTVEFTKPIDAKSKWLEMKKKFYGKNYAAAKEQPHKLEAQNPIKKITSVSKLPVHKIFQYNMQVGRARQMGTEPPSAEDIFLERKTTSPWLKGIENCAPRSSPRRNETQFLKSVISTSRCLSQTQSLSQWPSDLGNSYRAKKYCSREQKPKPKPRNDRGFNSDSIEGGVKTPTMSHGSAQFPQRPPTCANSSMSSSNVRDDQVLPLDWPSQVKNTMGTLSTKNANMSDEYANKIDSLVFFCRDQFSEPKESIDRNFKQAQYADQQFLDGVATADSS